MINSNVEQMPLPPPSNYGSVVPNSEMMGRVRSMSPPPPPLPTDDQVENASRSESMYSLLYLFCLALYLHNLFFSFFALSKDRRRVMPHDADLPGWVPKDYIDKGAILKQNQFFSHIGYINN